MRYMANETGRRGYYGNKSSAFLSLRKFKTFCSTVIRHPKINIVLPLLIAVILSSKLFSIAISARQIWRELNGNQYISKVEILDDHNAGRIRENSHLVLLQVWMRCVGENFDNILGKRTLLESLALQNKLLNNVSTAMMVKSPFQLWNHSLKNLRSDPAPLQTINSNLLSLPQYSFFGTWKINGLVSSAAGITISILVNSTDSQKLLDSLNYNVVHLNGMSNITNFHIFPPLNVNSAENESLRLYMIKLGSHYKTIFSLLHLAVFVYFVFSMKRLKKTVKSVVGIILAMVAQLLFTIGSAITLTNFFYKSSNDNIPFRALSCAVIFFTMNEQIRLLDDTSGSTFESKALEDSEGFALTQAYDPGDVTADRSFPSCAALSQIKSTKSAFLLSIVITFLIPFSRKATFFLLLSLWFGHFLGCTFFTAVLSLDHRRLEENDLISIDSNVLLDEEISSVSNYASLEQQLFRYLKSSCRNRYSVILTVLYLVIFNINFTVARSSSSLIFKVFRGGINKVFKFGRPIPNVIFDQKFIADAAFNLIKNDENQGTSSLLANLTVKDPFLVLKYQEELNLNELGSQLSSIFDASAFTASYKLDFYYVFEFLLSVVLLLSCTLLVLQKLMEKLDHINSFQFTNGDSLENSMTHAEAKRSKAGKNNYLQNLPHISEDTGSKLQSPNHFHAKELYRGGHSLDIVGISTSKCPFVVSVGLDYRVLVWSPLLKPIPNPTSIPLSRKFWPLSKVVLSNDGYYIAFFGKNGSITCWSRRQMKFVWELQLKRDRQTKDPSIIAPPLEAFFRKITAPAFRRRRLPPAAALRPDVNSRRSSVNSIDYAARLAEGGLDVAYEKVVFSQANPDEKDELVFVTPSGYLYSIQTDGELHVEKLTSSKHSLKSCKLLSSPRVSDRLVACDDVGDLYVSTVVNNKWRPRTLTVNYNRMLEPSTHFSKMEEDRSATPSVDEAQIMSKTDYTIELVSFVGLILRVIGKEAELIDAMTGCVIRTFAIGLLKPNSLRVFHDNPTHCRFCGSASVASFSIAYTSFDNERVALHTFKLESKTKNSICLRVERDPREIRCLGMESAFETVHYFYDAEDWCVTNNNMLIGIRRVPQNIKVKTGTTSVDTRTGTADNESSGLIRRKYDKSERESKVNDSSDFRIHNIWEGWTMTASGKISLQKIPIGVNGLLVNRLGPLTRYGAKAVIVGFSNIMNMFYVGHEELIFNPEKEDANKEELSLRFVNKRRDRLSNKKLPLNYSSL
ncbi:ZYRO0E04224p [Zygosaccharomyces rouxii]|uniref:ZYRO0E04224p n=2 Tax=Zygosaccharomyces rouxii TaxID=4956 RepID=C5E4A3_ZYGRC|nr:uncharacterized protein ZYRO0E04224g [Zygosaccharomyces rouxii]KAH9198279.1 hypothetical protein LQ764DRAFT_156496 [Zygosaccharomyces rouxii]CAQ43455.1 Uncharacterised protein KLLA0E11957g [Zygosaccharomyces rouxii]CAR30864.1 ZYRO0E04224p [Zygosaccharomyces rouxii]